MNRTFIDNEWGHVQEAQCYVLRHDWSGIFQFQYLRVPTRWYIHITASYNWDRPLSELNHKKAYNDLVLRVLFIIIHEIAVAILGNMQIEF